MAHINEHLAFKYRKDIEDQIGVPLPPPDQLLPEDLEVELSRLMAIGAKQLVDVNTANAQQQQNQQAAQDPVLQLQQQELKVKQAEVVRKTQKDMMDNAVKKAELQLKAMEQLHGAKMESFGAQLQSLQPPQPAQQPPQGK
jgi:hypothetical protein